MIFIEHLVSNNTFFHLTLFHTLTKKDNISELGGDPNKVFLSGHSAGGHIASLLMIRHDHYLKPLNIDPSFIKGLILVSGVYSLFSPLSKSLLDAKNKAFALLYMYPSFGSDKTVRREASPLILLEPNTDITLVGKVALKIGMKCVVGEPEKNSLDNKRVADSLVLNTSELPPTLIFNAAIDLGLESDGKRMAGAMGKYTQVQYEVIPKSDHGSICWTTKTQEDIAEFISRILIEGRKNDYLNSVQTKEDFSSL